MTIAVNRLDDASDLTEMVETLQALLDIERDRADSLKDAISFARRTGIAVGLVMAQNRVSADEAFSRIHAASSGVHRQLRDVVEAVIAGRLQL
jgi:AmiR/NasT family two-component response regulator